MKSENLPFILPEYIIEAAEQLDKIDLENLNKATKHHVLVKEKSYPPKELLRELVKLIETKKLNIDLGTTTGGPATNLIFENAGFEVVPFKITIPPLKNIDLLINLYKEFIREDNNIEEVYKWEAVKHFQFHWDIVNQEFGSVLKQSFGKRQNLMYQVSSWFLDILANQYPKEAREMFVNLYEETHDLNERIKAFQLASDEIIKKVSQKLNKKLNHQQDERAISFYLALRYPDRHIIYMSDVYTRVCAYLDLKPHPAGKKYSHFLELIESIKPTIKKDIELQDMVANTLTDLSWKDGDQSNLITQDIFYRTLKQHPEMLNEITVNKGSTIDTKPDKINNFKKPMNLNTILYGPPGTGKTYHTINKSLEILGEDLTGKNRTEIKELYDQKIAEGQIVFTTFHQSMSYEDFIEGIKPKTTTEKEVIYEIEDGIFKNLCNEASRIHDEDMTDNEFESAYRQLENDIVKAPDQKLTLKMKTRSKDFTISKNSNDKIHFHRKSGIPYEGDIKKDDLQHYLKTGETSDWASFVKPIGEYLIENYPYSRTQKSEVKNFVLIIDEINRGNLSQILGELITLIEDDKRVGKKEAISVTLPYSKESFSVPSNLYIIGTMNTADRSVEAIDTALRRRFKFEEIRPNPVLLENLPLKHLIDIPSILDTLNKRIEILKDRDYQIGHSYFINIETMPDLVNVFKENVIPLLQEYFFGDYKKIQLILGTGFIESKSSDIKFAIDDDDEFEDKIIYSIREEAFKSEANFKDALNYMNI